MKEAVGKAIRLFFALRGLPLKCEVNTKTLLQVYRGAAVPAVLYGAEIWGRRCAYQVYQRILDRGQRACMITCLCAYRTPPQITSNVSATWKST